LIALQGDGVGPLILHGLAAHAEPRHAPLAFAIGHLDRAVHLIALALAGTVLCTHPALEHAPQRGTVHGIARQRIRIREAGDKIAQRHDRPQPRGTHRPGSQQHHVHPGRLRQHVRQQVAERGLLHPRGMGMFDGQPRDDAVVFLVHHLLERVDVRL